MLNATWQNGNGEYVRPLISSNFNKFDTIRDETPLEFES